MHRCPLPQVCGSRTNSGSGFRSTAQPRSLRSQHSPENAARERSRVRNLRQAFHSLQVNFTYTEDSPQHNSTTHIEPSQKCPFCKHSCIVFNMLLNSVSGGEDSGENGHCLCTFFCPQAALPSVPPDTKLSKLDVLVLATNYIAYLTETLDQGGPLADHTMLSRPGGYLRPVKVGR